MICAPRGLVYAHLADSLARLRCAPPSELGFTAFRLVLSCLPRKKAGEKMRKQITFRRVLKPKMSLKRGSCLFQHPALGAARSECCTDISGPRFELNRHGA